LYCSIWCDWVWKLGRAVFFAFQRFGKVAC
jgi:hypothetical protein